MKWLITGGCGFIGSHVVEELLCIGEEVRVFARYTSSGSIGNLKYIPNDNYGMIYGDLRNPYITHQAMQDIDIVIHLASLISIPYSYVAPLEYFDVNTRSILNILEAAREHQPKAVVYISTSEVYGTAQYVPVDESHPLRGQSPYSASKIAAEKIVESYNLSFDIPTIIIRPFNTYGPRQSTRAVIPLIINQLLQGNELYMGDNINSTRDFVYVKDMARGIVSSARCSSCRKPLIGNVANIGTGQEISIMSLMRLIGTLMNVTPLFYEDPKRTRPTNSNVWRLCCNAELFSSVTGWAPDYTLGEGLEETIKFYQDHQEDYKIGKGFI